MKISKIVLTVFFLSVSAFADCDPVGFSGNWQYTVADASNANSGVTRKWTVDGASLVSTVEYDDSLSGTCGPYSDEITYSQIVLSTDCKLHVALQTTTRRSLRTFEEPTGEKSQVITAYAMKSEDYEVSVNPDGSVMTARNLKTGVTEMYGRPSDAQSPVTR